MALNWLADLASKPEFFSFFKTLSDSLSLCWWDGLRAGGRSFLRLHSTTRTYIRINTMSTLFDQNCHLYLGTLNNVESVQGAIDLALDYNPNGLVVRFRETITVSSIFINNWMFSMCQVPYASSCLIFAKPCEVNLVNPISRLKKPRFREVKSCSSSLCKW